jgi:pimeloyl-ACP methyl ester carboxylesterase
MPAVLVHGVPETRHVWDPVRPLLRRADILTPDLPGFSTPRPLAFGATKDEYVQWLVDELEAVGEPVDLVGHDWGGGFVLRLVSIRPDLVRTWVLDAGALADPSFVWHPMAQTWQTKGDGEGMWDAMFALPIEERAMALAAGGVPAQYAASMVARIDETMAGCILDLYRSATKVHEEWGPEFASIAKPGLVVVPHGDLFLDADGARRSAAKAGAGVAELDGLGHWWMLEDPERAAELLTDHWSSAGTSPG